MMKISINPNETFRQATRQFTLKSENRFKTPSTGLIKSWKILNNENEHLNAFVIFGNYELEITKIIPSFATSKTISVDEIRQYIREIDYPETEDDIKLLQLEDFICSQQIKSIQYYHSVPSSELYNCLFTSELNVYIELRDNFNQVIQDDLQIEETYWEKNLPTGNENETNNEKQTKNSN